MKSDLETLLSKYNHAIEDLQCAHDAVALTAVALADAVAKDGIAPDVSDEPAPRKKRTPKPATELKVPKKYIDREPAASGCLCGCGEDPTQGSQFIRGHAHTLSAIVKFVEADKLPFESIPPHAHQYLYCHEKVSKDLKNKIDREEEAAQ